MAPATAAPAIPAGTYVLAAPLEEPVVLVAFLVALLELAAETAATEARAITTALNCILKVYEEATEPKTVRDDDDRRKRKGEERRKRLLY